MLRALVAWVLLLLCANVAAVVPETPRLRVIGSADGLPATDIYGIARDAAGYVWIATNDGLARYDGTGMKVWRHDPDDPASLAGNTLYAVHVDHRDRIWVGGQGSGLSVLDAARTGFRHFRRDDHPQMRTDEVYSIASHGDEIWFGTYEGVYRLDAQEQVTAFVHDPEDPASLPADITLSVATDAGGALWAATFGGVARIVDGRVERMRLPGGEDAPLVYSVSRVGGEIWVGAGHGLFVTGGDGRWWSPSWAPMFERPNHVLAVARDSDGGMWLASGRRLWRVAAGSDIPMAVQMGPGNVVAPVKALLLQDDGALWVPVFGAGIGYLRSDWHRVAQFQRSPEGLEGDRYRGIGLARGGGVWLGAYNGAIERMGSGGTIERLDGVAAEAMLDGRIRAIAESESGMLWTLGRRGLTRIGNGTVDVWGEDDTPDGLPEQGLANILRTGPGDTLWIGIQDYGVQQRDGLTGKVLRNVRVGDESDNDWMDFGPDGALWIASRTGLVRLPPDGEPQEVEEMRGRAVHAFAFDGLDALWLQRLTGLERFERIDGRWQRTAEVGAAQGLPVVQGYGLLVDSRQRVWLSSTRGLYRWDPAVRVLRHYGVQHGLSSQEFLERALVLEPSGMLVGSTSDGGVVLVDTVADDPTPVTPELRLDNLSVRRSGEWHALAPGAPLVLSPGDQELRVSTRVLSFDDPLSNRYWSWLQGHEEGWVAQGASGERVFSNLPAGRYVLRLRAMDAAGNAAADQELSFEVLPPWWRSRWALLAMAATLLLSLLWMAHGYRTRVKRRSAWQLAEHKRELAEQASLAKTRFLATLGHEVRTPMTGVLGMSELLLRTDLDATQRGHAEAIRRAGEHLLRLVNDALDLARIEADRLELDLQPFDLHALVQDVVALTAPPARQRGLEFRHAIAADAPRWLRGDVVRIRQILLNLIGNAVKFTAKGSVGLRVEGLAPVGVRLTVSDTGPGLSDEQKQRLFRRFEQAEGARTAARYGGSGLGLAICQELAAAMEGRIEVLSAPGEGTSFIVDLPLPAAPAVSAPAPAAVRAAERTSGLQVLLVEDDATVAEVISGLLAARGHRVAHVANGLAALAESATRRFDIGLLDLDLPGIDGLALVPLLRGQGFDRPLLAVTARADADVEALVAQAGFDGFLRKPLTGEMLEDAIDAAMAAPRGDQRAL